MATPARAKRPKPTKPAKKAGKPPAALPYDELIKLAPKMKPPQSWYDEDANPFEPEARR